MKFPPGIDVYGSKAYRGDCPLEVQEQVTLFAEIRRRWPDTVGVLALHPRNEGRRDWRRAATEQAEGMATGASDLIVPGSPALVLELKRRDHTRCALSRAERDYLLAANDAGAYACIALGWCAAVEAIADWRKKSPPGMRGDR